MKASEVRKFSSSSYGEDELEALAEALLRGVGPGSIVVEIGSQYGSSTSAIMMIAKEVGYAVYCIDPFKSEADPEIGPKFMRNMQQFDYPFAVLVMPSVKALYYLPKSFDAIHIDGDHSKEGVELDCCTYLPFLRKGGIAIFHDYGRCGAPDVKPVVDSFTIGWEVLHSGSLKIVRKP